MDYKKVNEVLKNMSNLSGKYKRVQSNQSADYWQEKDQGDTGEKTEVFELGFDGMFLKVVSETDSYGDNERVTSVQFVQPVQKTVTDYDAV